MERKKVVYIAGPITGVENYRETFKQAEEDLEALGYIPLNPANLPVGMTNADYARIDLAMLGCADAILLLEGWTKSNGALLEEKYAQYTERPRVAYRTKSPLGSHEMDEDERRAWLYCGLRDAFAWAPKQEGVIY